MTFISTADGSLDRLGDLELRHLAALRAVAEARSFGRAAEVLGYTQSAVSQQIAALERLVGEPLFDRPGGPKPVSLTRAGEVLLAHAEAVLDRVRAAQADLAAYRAGRLGRIAVGTYQSVSVKIVPEVMRRLRAERPDIEVTLSESDEQPELIAALLSGDLDVSFIVSPADEDEFEVTPLAVDPFVVVSPRDAALARRGKAVPAEKLNEVPIVGQTPNACQLQIEGGLRAIGVDADIVFRTGDNSAVQAMVRSGMGHAVMPLLALDTNDPGVSIHPIDPPVPPRTIGIAVPRARHRPPAVDTFIAVARDVCAELGPALAVAS